ncbi:MAG: MoaD family protein [Kiritimatiellia bacterium]|jgi:MoaD family protein
MKITLRYTAQLAMEAGGPTESIEIDEGTTIDAVIQLLASTHGGRFSELLLNDQGDPHPTIMRIVNGEQIDRAQPPKLREGDELMLMSPIAGG